MAEAADRADPDEEIMTATYRALCRHGYADLTMQDIADESTMSKAALHYHYDSKHRLLLAFLDHLFECFDDCVPDPEAAEPVAGLEAYLSALLDPPRDGADREFRTALLEIKAQAPYVGAFRERLAEFDSSLRTDLAALLAAGIDEGTVRAAVDPSDAAAFLVTVLVGAGTRTVAVGDGDARIRRTLADYVDGTLLAPATREVDL